MKRASATAALLLLAAAAAAQQLQPGDLLIASGSSLGAQRGVYLDQHSHDGRYLRSLSEARRENTLEAGVILVEGTTRLYADRRDRISRLHADGTLGEPFGPPFRYVYGLTVDAAGNLYAAIDVPNSFGSVLVKLDRAGNIVREYLGVKAGYAFDLAGDQCTLYYMRTDQAFYGDIVEAWQVIARYDVCTGAPLPDVLTRRGPQYTTQDWSLSMRVVKNGLLISTMRSLEHRGFDGRLINEYRGCDFEFFKLALDPDGETFWTGLGSRLSRFHLDTMQRIGTAETGQTEASPHFVHAMTVVEGWRAARTGSRPFPFKRPPSPRTAP